MKKVLIAIDYNPVSEKIAHTGYKLAKQLGAKVCLMHVITDISFYGVQYPTFMGYDGYSGINAELHLASEMGKVAEDFLESASQHLNDPMVSTYLGEGDTAKTILKYSETWNADLIVLGTHSHSALEKLLMGTVASSVMEKTKIPLFMVPIKK